MLIVGKNLRRELPPTERSVWSACGQPSGQNAQRNFKYLIIFFQLEIIFCKTNLVTRHDRNKIRENDQNAFRHKASNEYAEQSPEVQ